MIDVEVIDHLHMFVLLLAIPNKLHCLPNFQRRVTQPEQRVLLTRHSALHVQSFIMVAADWAVGFGALDRSTLIAWRAWRNWKGQAIGGGISFFEVHNLHLVRARDNRILSFGGGFSRWLRQYVVVVVEVAQDQIHLQTFGLFLGHLVVYHAKMSSMGEN